MCVCVQTIDIKKVLSLYRWYRHVPVYNITIFNTNIHKL